MNHTRTRTRKSTRILTCSVAALAAVLVSRPVETASAQSYGINYSGTYQDGDFSVTGTLGPGDANQANWNNIFSPQSVNGGGGGDFDAVITDRAGLNGITLHTTFGNPDGGNDGSTPSPNNDFNRLYSTGIRLGDVWCRATTDVAPYEIYDVYIYNVGKNFTVNGTNISGGTGPLGTDFVLGQNYVKVTGLTGALSLQANDSINGFSIVSQALPKAYWTGGANPSVSWSDLSNFSTLPIGAPALANALDASTEVIFNADTSVNSGNTQLGGNKTIHSLTFGSNATSPVGIGGDTLTIASSMSGIKVLTGSANHTITSNVALGNSQTWTVTDAGQTLLVSGDISGASKTLTKAGAGTLTLSGTNTHSGSTTVGAGVLVVASDTALGATGGAGATLKFTGGTLRTTAAITSGRPVEVAAGGGTVDTDGFNSTFSGATSGAGTLTKTGAGTLSLTGTGPGLTGQVNVTQDELITNASVLAAPVVLSNNSNLTFNQGTDGTYSKVVSGVGQLTKEGAGVLTLAGSHTYNGETKITEGTLRLAQGAAYPVSGLVGKWTFDDGNANDLSGNNYHGAALGTPTYSSADTHGNTGQALVLDGSSGIKVDTGGSQTVFNGGTSMTISAWVKGWPGDWSPFVSKNGEGDGWQMRRHGDTNNLDWTARGLDSNGGSDFQGTSNSVANGQWHMVTMTYDGAQRKIYVDGALDATRDNNETIATGSNALLTFGARNYGDPNSFDAHFNGKLDDIYFYNRALTAQEILNAFNDVGGGGDILPSGTTVTMSAGTTLDLNGINQQVGALKDEGGAGSRPVLLAGATLKIGNATNAETTFSGAISGAGNVEKTGTSIQTLTGAQQYDTLTVSEGTLNVNGAVGVTPANGTGSVVVADGAKLKFGSVSQTLNSLTIGAGATVVFTSGVASGAFGEGGKGAGFGGNAAVPEPGTLGLLLVGALGVLSRRRRQA